MFRLFLFFSLSVCFSLPATQYLLHDMGLWDYGQSHATSINNSGQVIGYLFVENDRKTFIWEKEKGCRIIEKIPNGAYAVQINNKGQVLGDYYEKEGWWSPKHVLHPFIWSEKEGFRDLGSIDSENTKALSINDQGQVVVITTDSQCYLWEDGDYKKIDAATHVIMDKESNVVCGVLNDQEFAYVRRDPSDKKNPIALYRINLKTNEVMKVWNPKKDVPYLTCSNGQGTLAGYIVRPNRPNEYEGFVIGKGGAHTTIHNFCPNQMNERGVVVGSIYSDGNQDRGGIYQNECLLDINELLLPPEKQQIGVQGIVLLAGISNSGWVIGVAQTWDKFQAVLLIPQEEN